MKFYRAVEHHPGDLGDLSYIAAENRFTVKPRLRRIDGGAFKDLP